MAEFVVLLAPKIFECNVTALSEKATKVPENFVICNYLLVTQNITR